MSGPGRPPLCNPEHVSRARELCARGATNPDLLEPTLWARQQNDRRKGRKGRKPRILRKWGPLRRWREAAETGGNWRKPPAGTLLEKLSAVLPSQPRGALHPVTGTSLAEIAETPCRYFGRRPDCGFPPPPPTGAPPLYDGRGNGLCASSPLERRFDRAEAREFAARLGARRKIAQPRPRTGGDRLAFADAAAPAHRVVDHPAERTHRIDGAQPAALVDDDVAVDDQPHLLLRP